MKNVFILLLIIGLLFLLTNEVFATSGCCSHHGGVDCSRVQDDGSVVCNDAWLGSSCSYSSMVKCKSSSTTSNQTSQTLDDSDSISNDILGWGILGVLGYFGIKKLKKR